MTDEISLKAFVVKLFGHLISIFKSDIEKQKYNYVYERVQQKRN